MDSINHTIKQEINNESNGAFKKTHKRTKRCKQANQLVDTYIGFAKKRKEPYTHTMPNFFNGTLEQYILWLKYYQKQAKLNNIEVLVHLDGKFKLIRNY